MKPDRPPSADDPVVSIVHHPIETDYLEATVTSIRPHPVEAFLTPWGIGAIFIFLVANSLLSWSQWFSPSPSASIAQAPRFQPKALGLDTLIFATKPASQPVAQRSIAPAAIVPVKPIVNRPQPAGSLTNALLPPSLQPALMPVHPLPVSQVRQSSPTVVSLPTPPPNVEILDRPSSPAVSPGSDPAVINERMLDQLRQREESPANLPFYQREKARRQAVQTGRDASEVMKQLPPQLQIQPPRTVPTLPPPISSSSPQPAVLPPIPSPSPQPAVPSSIIIDRSGSSVR